MEAITFEVVLAVVTAVNFVMLLLTMRKSLVRECDAVERDIQVLEVAKDAVREAKKGLKLTKDALEAAESVGADHFRAIGMILDHLDLEVVQEEIENSTKITPAHLAKKKKAKKTAKKSK